MTSPPVSRWRSLDTPYLPETRWTFPDAIIALGAGFAAAIAAGSVLIAVTGTGEIGIVEIAVTLLAQSAASIAALVVLVRRRGDGTLPPSVGLAWRWADTWGVGAGLVLQVVVAVVVGSLIQVFGPDDPPQQAVAEVTGGANQFVEIAVLLILLVVVAPVVEEIVYRGVLLSRLRRSMGPWPSILASAALFAAVHLADPAALFAVPGLFVIGAVLGWLAMRSGDIGLPIAVHAGVNLTGALALIFEDALTDAVETAIQMLS